MRAGQRVEQGDPVLISLLAANRDPAAFTSPDAFSPGRDDARRQLAFGLGPHVCMGAALARMQAEVALGTVLRRFPDIELGVPALALLWWPSPIMRGLFELPVRL